MVGCFFGVESVTAFEGVLSDLLPANVLPKPLEES